MKAFWEAERRRRFARLDREIAALERELEEKLEEYARLAEESYEDVAAERAIDRGREL